MRENRCDRLRQTWQINQPTFTTYNCKGETLPTSRQTNTRMAWCRGGTRAGTTGGWTSSSARRRRSQTCRGILRCRRSRQDSVLWRLLDRWSSQSAHMSSCSSRWCRIWKSWRLTGWSGNTQHLLPALREPPQAEQGLEEIIGDDDCFDVIRFTILHVPKFQCKIWVTYYFDFSLPWSSDFANEDIEDADEGCRPYGGHHGVGIRPSESTIYLHLPSHPALPRVPEIHHEVIVFVHPAILNLCRAKIHPKTLWKC